VEFVDAASNYFARIWRYQVTRFRPDFPAVCPTEPSRQGRRQHTPSQRRADRQERRQASQRRKRNVGTVLRIESAIFPDKHYVNDGRAESADIPIDYKLLRHAINPVAMGCAEFLRRWTNSLPLIAFHSE
jgi:hypothetical protein